MPSPTRITTDAYLHAIRQVEAGHRRWPLVRWLVLACSIAVVGLGVRMQSASLGVLYAAAGALSDASASAPQRSFDGSFVVLSCVATKKATIGQALQLAGLCLLGWLVARWRGNPNHILLLGLATQRERQSQFEGPA